MQRPDENHKHRGQKSSGAKRRSMGPTSASASQATSESTADSTLDGESDSEESIMGDVSEDIFFDLADSFIQLANEHSRRLPVESISSALAYAASRYNAFLAVSEEPVDRLEPDTAADFYTLQYRKMFEDNFEEYDSQQNVTSDDTASSD